MNVDFLNDGVIELIKKLEGWGEGIIKMLPNFILALVVVMIFWLISSWVKKTMNKVFKKSHFGQSLNELLANVCKVTVICIGLLLALGVLDLQKTVFSLLAGVGVIGLALGFAFQDLASNFMSGIMLAVRSPMRIGDVVKINDIMGTVEEIRIRDTIIKNFEGQEVFIPNKEFTGNAFTNYSSNGKRKILIEAGIGYEDDAREGLKVFERALKSVEGVLSDPEPQVHVTELGGSSVNLKGHIWIEYPGESYLSVKTNALVAAKTELENAGFNIPFPIRTLDVPDETIEKIMSFREKESKEASEKTPHSDKSSDEQSLQ